LETRGERVNVISEAVARRENMARRAVAGGPFGGARIRGKAYYE